MSGRNTRGNDATTTASHADEKLLAELSAEQDCYGQPENLAEIEVVEAINWPSISHERSI